MAKFVRLIDMKRCIGCRSCAAACAVENHFTPDAPWNVVHEYEVGTYPAMKKVYTPMSCMHCEKPACKTVCDQVGAQAISKNQFGATVIDYDKCNGCGYCAAVCPYGVPQYNSEVKPLSPGNGPLGAENLPPAQRHPSHRKKAKVVEKCTFCSHKLEKAAADGKLDRIGKDQEYTPSCDLVCPTQARLFGDLDDPQSEVAKRIGQTKAVPLLKKFNTVPQVYYVLEEGAEA